MLVENNIYIYIYHPRDVCAIENAVAILPLIYKKWSQENLKGKKNGNQSLVPNYFFLGLSYKSLLIKKKKKNYTVQMEFIYKNNPYLLKNSRGLACCHVNSKKKKKLKINSVSVCSLTEPLFACNILSLCLSGFNMKADET